MADVLVDTCIWSVVLRRVSPDHRISAHLQSLIHQGRAQIIGLVRQELLTGIKHPNQYEILKAKLRAFRDVPISSETHEYAAVLGNACIAKGLQGSPSDFLLCAVAKENKMSLFTTDLDFVGFAKIIGLDLYQMK